MIILDTHTLVWLDEGSTRLGQHSLSTINLALKSQELFVSAISFWEVAMLVNKGRIIMQMSIESWRKGLIDNGLQEIPLTGGDGIKSALLSNFHGDPADRMIVATTIESNAILCTADKKILTWDQSLQRIDARE